MKIYKYLLCKLLIALGVLWIAQLLFGLFNPRIFNLEQGEWLGVVWGNVRFGLATVSAYLLPYFILMLVPLDIRWKKGYRILAETCYYLPMAVIIGTELVDCAYYQFTYRRMSNEMLGYLGVGGDMGNLIPLFLRDYWTVAVAGIALIALFVVANRRLKLMSKKSYDRGHLNELACFGLGMLLCFFFIRGGLQRHFISLDDAARHCQMKNTSLVVSSPYSILRTLYTDDIPDSRLMDTLEAQKLYTPEFASIATLQSEGMETAGTFSGPFAPGKGGGKMVNDTIRTKDTIQVVRRMSAPKNVVVIVLESFSQEYMGCYNNGIMQSFTPFLDSLSRNAILLDGRSNGKKSIEAIPAVFASIPSLQEKPFIINSYYGDSIVALPSILRQNGYHTAFFHGGYNGSMNFDKFCVKAGFDHYYGRNEYGNDEDYDHAWGIFDEPFLQYVAHTLDSMPQPFFGSIFTISSHHPYAIPECHKGEFLTGSHPLLQCVNYSDFALRRFFESCAREPWYGNTLFLIMADHPGQGLHREYNDYDGWYDIPMIVFDPSATPDTTVQQQYRHTVMQQIDVMPTLLDYLGIKGHYVCFGQSLWQRSNDYQVVYGNGYYQLLRDGRIAAFQGNRTIGEEEDVNFLRALIQTYHQRMRNNQLTSIQ